MNIPKGYKQTELGLIPEDWEIRLFSQTFNIYPNNTYPRDCMNNSCGEVRNIHYGDVLIKYPTIVDVEKCSIPYLNKNVKVTTSKFVQSGDVIIADTAEDETVGKCIEIKNDAEIKIVSGLHTFFCRPTIPFASGWLGYYINSSSYHNQLLPFITGIKVSSISRQSIQGTKLLLPPLSEQKAIAKALSDVDDLIAALDKKIAKKRLVKQGAMQQLLTGKKRLPGFTEEWVDRKLCNFGFMVRGVSYKPEQSSLSPKEGYSSLLRSNNVQGDSIVYSDYVYVDNNYVSEKQKIVKNDILICIANGSKQLVGKSALIEKEGDFTFGAFMGVFRCEDQNIAPFVVSLMHSECYKKQIEDILTGSAINNLNASTIESMLFFVPASTEEQLAIASMLSDMDKEIANLEKQRENYSLLKSGMMQKLLTGQIRLKTK